MVFRFRFCPPLKKKLISGEVIYFPMAGKIENERPYLKLQGQRPLSLKLKLWPFIFDFAHHWQRMIFQRELNACRLSSSFLLFSCTMPPKRVRHPQGGSTVRKRPERRVNPWQGRNSRGRKRAGFRPVAIATKAGQ